VIAAAELIADEGIGALTNQRIAARLNASTTIVTHYFRSKRELMLHTYETMASRSRARVEQAVKNSSDPLAACLHALLPLDAETVVEWKVWLAYQGMSVGDRELMEIWASRSTTAVNRVERLILADIADGRTPPSVDAAEEATRLFALVSGISVQSLVDPAHFSPARLGALVDRELAALRSVSRTRAASTSRGRARTS
jgi:AcrR family transcriptional regulator